MIKKLIKQLEVDREDPSLRAGIDYALQVIKKLEEMNVGDSHFDEFWAAYPNKKSKVVAQKIWKRLNVDDVLFVKIMAALELVKRTPQWTKNGGEFIPHPSTWLNQERWNDEVKVVGALPTNTKYDGI